MSTIIGIVALLVLVGCAFLIPLGLPGLWLMAVVSLGLVLGGLLTWTTALVVVGLVVTAELGEFALLKKFGSAYGGSRRAFWGALVGGMGGLFFGLPVPLIGSVITAFLGTFVGAGLVTLLETRSVERSARVGWGVLLARTAAVALKLGTGVSVIGLVAIALLFRS